MGFGLLLFLNLAVIAPHRLGGFRSGNPFYLFHTGGEGNHHHFPQAVGVGSGNAAVGDEHLLGDAHALYQFRFHPAATQVSHPLCRCLIVARGGITAHRDVHPPCTQVVDVGLQHGAKAVQLRLVAGVGHIEHVFPRHKAEHKGGIRCCCRFVLCLACQRKQCEQEGKSCSFHSSYHSLFMD